MKYEYVSERTRPQTIVRSPQEVYSVLSNYASKKQEHFLVITLKANHEIHHVRIVSIGLINRTLVHPREVFAPAIQDRAIAIVIAHNHPSGNCEPSEDDRAVTSRLVKAGEILGIPVLDHIIFSKNQVYKSFMELGELSLDAKAAENFGV